MKTIFLLGGILLLLMPFASNAQPPVPTILPDKPLLFTDFPEEFKISTQAIQKIFTGSSTGYIKISAENNGFFEGYVTERVRKSAAVLTVNIKLTNYDGALFTVSKITDAGDAITYVGRIVHRNYGDVLLLHHHQETITMKKEKQAQFLVE